MFFLKYIFFFFRVKTLNIKETSEGLSPVGLNGLDGTVFTTPLSSINITPTGPDQFNSETVGIPKIILPPDALVNITPQNSEFFSSPNSAMFTSSPQTNELTPNKQQKIYTVNFFSNCKTIY